MWLFSFNLFDLPEYQSKEIMLERILYAIKETSGFGQAWQYKATFYKW